MRRHREVLWNELNPVRCGTGGGSGIGKHLLVFLVVPEVSDLDAHLHRSITAVRSRETYLEGNAGLEFLAHLGRSKAERLRSRGCCQQQHCRDYEDKCTNGRVLIHFRAPSW